jgi:hypothetical protein
MYCSTGPAAWWEGLSFDIEERTAGLMWPQGYPIHRGHLSFNPHECSGDMRQIPFCFRIPPSHLVLSRPLANRNCRPWQDIERIGIGRMSAKLEARGSGGSKC